MSFVITNWVKVKFSMVILQEGFRRGATTLTDTISGEIDFHKWAAAENGEYHYTDSPLPPHLFPLLRGVDVCDKLPPHGLILRLGRQCLLSQIHLWTVRPPPLRSSYPSPSTSIIIYWTSNIPFSFCWSSVPGRPLFQFLFYLLYSGATATVRDGKLGEHTWWALYRHARHIFPFSNRLCLWFTWEKPPRVLVRPSVNLWLFVCRVYRFM